MITLDRVTADYPDAKPLDDISLTLQPGSTAIMGPSGSGKSTLLRIMGGMQAPTSGAVYVHGTEVAAASWRSPSDARVSLIHQDYRLVPFLTVEENLLLAAELRGLRRTEAEVRAVLERVDLPSSMRGRLPSTLSGGQQQRVAIARTMMSGASVILADEPTGALDVTNTRRIAQVLADLGRHAELTVVVATHDHGVAEHMDRRLVFERGKLADTV